MGIHQSVRINLSVLGFICTFFLCLLVLPTVQQASQRQALRQSNDASSNRQTIERKRRIIQSHKLPLEVKYEIRNLQNDNWPKDLEIEIKNVSNKPIYYIYIFLIMDEVKLPVSPAAFILEYGDKKFFDKLQSAEEGDVPIKPGESQVLKIPESQIENVKKKAADLGIEFNITKVEFNLYKISFGDGTGYSAGAAYNLKKKEPPATPQASSQRQAVNSPSLQSSFMTSKQILSERKMEVKKLPADVLKIKGTKNLQLEDWRKLEIEVENISKKPIYYMALDLRFPDVPPPGAGGGACVILLTYGDNRLNYPEERPQPEDVPIKPGETYIFKVPEGPGEGLASHISKYDFPLSTTFRLEFIISDISFGDGTGIHNFGRPVRKKG